MFEGPGELEVRNGGGLHIYRDRTNGVLVYWYGAPAGADIHDPEVWKACNPASWLQDGKALTREYNRLKGRGALLQWRMYHLNQSVSGTEDPWMPLDDWQACEGDPVFRPDLRTYAVVRIAHDHRAAAVAVAQRQGERVALRVRSFPEGPLEEGEYLPPPRWRAICATCGAATLRRSWRSTGPARAAGSVPARWPDPSSPTTAASSRVRRRRCEGSVW